MEPFYVESGSYKYKLRNEIHDNINYVANIYIPMFVFGFNKYGELRYVYSNDICESCYKHKKIKNIQEFSLWMKVFKMDDI